MDNLYGTWPGNYYSLQGQDRNSVQPILFWLDSPKYIHIYIYINQSHFKRTGSPFYEYYEIWYNWSSQNLI